MNKGRAGSHYHVQLREVCIIISIIMPYSDSETAFILSCCFVNGGSFSKVQKLTSFPTTLLLLNFLSDSLKRPKRKPIFNIFNENHRMKHILRDPGKNNKSGESASNTYYSAQTQSTVDGGLEDICMIQ